MQALILTLSNSVAGWYYVERRSDGGKGWVPISVTREIESSHVRARNYKQRYAFLKLLSNAEDPQLASWSPLNCLLLRQHCNLLLTLFIIIQIMHQLLCPKALSLLFSRMQYKLTSPVASCSQPPVHGHSNTPTESDLYHQLYSDIPWWWQNG